MGNRFAGQQRDERGDDERGAEAEIHDGPVLRADGLMQPVQPVIDLLPGAGERPARIERLLLDPVAHGVQRVHDLVAEPVLELRQPVRAVVGVLHVAAVGQGDFGELSHPVVVVDRLFPAHRARGEPAPRVIGEGRYDPVRIGDGQWPAVQVVGRDRGDVAERVGDALHVAALAQVRVIGGVVGGGRRLIVGVGRGEHLAVAVVGVLPYARRAGQRRGEALLPCRVGRLLHRLRANHAHRVATDQRGGRRAVNATIAVVGAGGGPVGLGDLRRQAPERVPLRRHLAHVGAAGECGQHRTAGLRRQDAFRPRGFQVARQVVGVTNLLVVEIRARRDIAIRVVGKRRPGDAAGRAGVGNGRRTDTAVDVDRGVGDRGTERRRQGEGSRGAFVAVVRRAAGHIGRRVAVPVGAAGELGSRRLAITVVGDAEIRRAILIGGTGQQRGLVRIAPAGRTRIMHRHQQRAAVGGIVVGDGATVRQVDLLDVAVRAVHEGQAPPHLVGHRRQTVLGVVPEGQAAASRRLEAGVAAVGVVGLDLPIGLVPTPFKGPAAQIDLGQDVGRVIHGNEIRSR